MTDRTEQSKLVADCVTRESRLSDFERHFIDSIGDQLERGRDLSKKQSELLDEIWTRATELG